MEVEEEKLPEARKGFVVPEDYLQNETETIRKLESKLRNAEKDQNELDEIYGEVVALLNRGLVEIRVKIGSRGRRQPWFTKEIAGLRRQFHKAELQWLQCKSLDERRILRKWYLEMGLMTEG